MDEALDLRRYWLIVRRWLWLIILLAVLAGGTAYFFSARQIPLYRATATLLMQPSSAMRQDYVFYRTPEQFSQTYIQMMTGRPVIQAAQAKLRGDPPLRHTALSTGEHWSRLDPRHPTHPLARPKP